MRNSFSNSILAKIEVIKNYTDLVGIVTVDRNPTYASTLNGLMHTSFAICLYADLNILRPSDVTEFNDLVLACQDMPGLYDRYPAVGDKPRLENLNGHDDYRGIAAASVMTGLNFHKHILNYGIAYGFFYDNENESSFFNKSFNPLKWNWRGLRIRMWKDVLFYFLINKKLKLFSPILMLAMFISSLSSKPTYHKILNYMLVTSMSRVSWIWKKFRPYYMRKSYLTQATKEYFKEGHPLIILASEVHLNGDY